MTDNDEKDLQSSSTTYRVQQGDTLVGIALRNNMKVSDLKYLNHMFGSDDVYKGQILQVSKRQRQRSMSLPHAQFPLLKIVDSHLPLHTEENILTTTTDEDEEVKAKATSPKGIPTIKPCTSPELVKRHSITGEDVSVSEKNTLTRSDLTRSATELPSVFNINTLPKLLGGSSSEILSDESVARVLVPQLESCLARHNKGYDWKLLYSLQQHGASLGTLYRMVYKKSPTIIVVETSRGEIFGAFASVPIHSEGHYYGNGECFLYTTYPEFIAYPWTLVNSMFIYSTDDSLAIGGGGGFGLYLNSDLSKGSSARCHTFENKCLASEEDFNVVSVEVWGFVTKR